MNNNSQYKLCKQWANDKFELLHATIAHNSNMQTDMPSIIITLDEAESWCKYTFKDHSSQINLHTIFQSAFLELEKKNSIFLIATALPGDLAKIKPEQNDQNPLYQYWLKGLTTIEAPFTETEFDYSEISDLKIPGKKTKNFESNKYTIHDVAEWKFMSKFGRVM